MIEIKSNQVVLFLCTALIDSRILLFFFKLKRQFGLFQCSDSSMSLDHDLMKHKIPN